KDIEHCAAALGMTQTEVVLNGVGIIRGMIEKHREDQERRGAGIMRKGSPMLFNTEMVRAILDGRKRTTRRTVGFLPGENPNWTGYQKDGLVLYNGRNEPCSRKPPYQPGDILYVRETWAFIPCAECAGDGFCGKVPALHGDRGCYLYRAGFPEYADPGQITWRPSIHMPKAAARIWLRVTDVGVGHLQAMKLDDFLDEGVAIRPEAFNDPEDAYMQARGQFASIWDSTMPKGQQALYGWDADPWVWAIGFERCGRPGKG
ncbi:MAG: hypothetical protein NC121_19660, partial [Blautia sp.]|nr:hypothetical protein [Blautia sp.]